MTIKVFGGVLTAAALVVHVITGTIIFLVTNGAALGLSVLLERLDEAHLMPGWLSIGAHGLEIFIWVIDIALNALLIGVEAIRFAREFLKG